MKRLAAFLIIFLSVTSATFSSISNIGLDPLDQSAGARPLGMSSAYTADSGDLNSLFHNPAGLAGGKGFTFSLKDTKNMAMALGYDMGPGNLGIGFVYKSVGPFKYNAIDSTYDTNMALVGYGFNVGQFDIGVTGKALLSQRLSIKGASDLVSSSGNDVDFGLIWKPNGYLSLGTVMHNATGGNFTVGSSIEAFPKTTKVGLQFVFLGENALFKSNWLEAKVNVDSISGSANDLTYSDTLTGLELLYNDWLYLRAGSSILHGVNTQEASLSGSSFGFGIKFKEMSFDIGTAKEALTGLSVSQFSITYSPKEFVIFTVPKNDTKATPKKDLLVIAAPDDDLLTYSDTVNIEGDTRQGAEIMINGALAFVSDAGKFNVIQPLNLGKNLLQIEATDVFGKKTIQKKVLRKAKIKIAEETDIEKRLIQEINVKEDELNKRQQKINNLKARGTNVSALQAQLDKEVSELYSKKQRLIEEKKLIGERKEKVENLATLGVIEVSPEKNFEVEAPIKRGEMLSWLVKAAGLATEKPAKTLYIDVPENSEWAPYVKAALEKGYIQLDIERRFRPNDPVTEAEAQELFKAFGVIK